MDDFEKMKSMLDCAGIGYEAGSARDIDANFYGNSDEKKPVFYAEKYILLRARDHAGVYGYRGFMTYFVFNNRNELAGTYVYE